MPRVIKKYICQICNPNYQYCQKSNYIRHLSSNIHKENINKLNNVRLMSIDTDDTLNNENIMLSEA